MTFCIGSCQLTFHSSLTIQSYTSQLNILTNWTNSSHHEFCFNISRIGRLITDWSVQNMNPDMTLYSMFLDVSVQEI